MKRYLLKAFTLLLIVSILSVSTIGCYGSMSLSKRIYVWNGGFNKVANTVIMWALLILPVYELCGLVDVCILNVIEFWTGTNPFAMEPDQKEMRIIRKKGETFEVTASKNRFDVERRGDGAQASLLFDDAKGEWRIVLGEKSVKVAEYDNDKPNALGLILPNGRMRVVDSRTVKYDELCSVLE